MATNYLVLIQDPEDETSFRFQDVVEADHGPEQAVRRYTEDLSAAADGERLYVAVPVRNWNVVPRRVIVPAPRIEIGEIDSAEWLAGYVVANRAVSEVSPLDHEATVRERIERDEAEAAPLTPTPDDLINDPEEEA